MNIYFVLSLVGVALAAPIAEEEKSMRPIVKRAMETIMFGNQQNSNKQVKKSDPSVPLRDDLPDVKGPVLPDTDGIVEASKAVDLSKLETDKSSKEEREPVIELESSGDKSKESDSSLENGGKDAVENDHSSEESEIPADDAKAIEELQKSMGEDKQESTDLQANGNGYSQESGYENEPDLYELYQQYQRMLSGYPDSGLNYYNHYKRRRSAPSKRRFIPNLKEKVVKRAHRTKRDLTYPDEELYDPYYFPNMPYSDNDLYNEYENSYGSQNQISPLDEMLAENEEYESPYFMGQYEEPSWYDYQPLRYEDDNDVFVPTKRQMLSFVPGNRKRSYFYPVSEEPQTHFGAFVPQKRDYFSTYGNLVRAARLLAAKESEREEMQGYPEWE